jgi:hypothetical protein
MFMFRLALYLVATKTARGVDGAWPIAYFFMLPNLAFPLFPVIDYQTFKRTYFDRPATEIYLQGLLWIARGLVHLLLYRVVYHAVLNDPTDVVRLSDLVQFMLGTFLLYLRVSGQFHLCIGLLHLFGFRLPETHRLYYLANSFTELWRRINIYWTDFMMKVVFYPTYFRVKRLGPERALVASTIAVFVTTWLLHSYQWFWIRGGFPVTLQDTLFWGALGAFVVFGALRELKAGKPVSRANPAWSLRRGLHAAATFAVFCFLWSLWSTDSVGEWLWTLAAASRVDARGVVLIVVALATIVALGGRDWHRAGSHPRTRLQALWRSPLRTAATLALLLLLSTQSAIQARVPSSVAAGLRAMHQTGLNARDEHLQDRGYYEQLEVRGTPQDALAAVLNERREQWQTFASSGVLREHRGELLTRDLHPSRRVTWNGKSFSTNNWGMRDQEYALAKSPGTFRIALLGPSFVMGSGVADGETFETLVEDRLNRDFNHPQFERFEILNFAVEGQTAPEQVALLEDRVFAFEPDVVILTHYYPARSWTERYLTKVACSGSRPPAGQLATLLAREGLGQEERGIPIPFATARRVASWFGVESRMPSSECAARVRWVADSVVEWALQRFAAVTAEHGTAGIVLGLNSVIDHAPATMPQSLAIEKAGLPVIDLFDIYPKDGLAALRVAPWDYHPNDAGHRLIAEHLFEKLIGFVDANGAGRRVARSIDERTQR